MEGAGDFEVTRLRISLEPQANGAALRPVVHGGELVIPNSGFVKILGALLGNEIVLPQVRLTYLNSMLIAGGAEIVVRAKRGIIDQKVRTQVALSPAGNGDLRLTITDMRVGRFAAHWLLDFVLGAVDRVPGLRKSGSTSIDVDLATLLASRNVAVDLAAGVTGVNATADSLAIHF
jgi:hypothetical protein